MNKTAVFAGLGDYYSDSLTGFSRLPFIYKNINDFTTNLKSKSWTIAPPMLDLTASKKIINDKLSEVINNSHATDDWILFYYTGHASKYITAIPNSNVNIDTYCVSYSPNLKYNFLPPLNEFISEIDYDVIIQKFKSKFPDGHLITILDCCYAFGLIENFENQSDFHTIIAASSETSPAYYNNNSLFFKAFSQCYDLQFEEFESKINRIMNSMLAPGKCKIRIATKFKTSHLNNL